MLTVLSWFWIQPGGRTAYTAEHVNVWAAMVRRHLSMPHRIACVTAHAEGIDSRVEIITPPGDFEGVTIPTWGPSMPQCLRRLAMFRPDAGAIFGDRFVCMDIDSVIGASLDPLFDRPDDLVLYRGTTPGRTYNGSMLMMAAGARPQVYGEFTPERAARAGGEFVGSDQAWLAYILGEGEATWGSEHGVYWRSDRFEQRGAAPRRVVFFPGDAKPWQFRDHWIEQHYRADRRGRCLVLGYAPSVWDDARAALAAGPVDAVIAAPEAAEHWPGPVLATARDDEEAERIARRHGFDEVVFCGRTERMAV